ncbi:MAG: MACPF domain-containing protein [Chitinispirillia bacterium]|nr:MACPF domain-containing protein [Chitinispirillia bacterium]
MSVKKLFLCMSAAAVTAGFIITGCGDSGTGPDGETSNPFGDSEAIKLALAALNDSARAAEALEYTRRMDSVAAADAQRSAGTADTLATQDSLAHLKLLERIANPEPPRKPAFPLKDPLPKRAAEWIGNGYNITSDLFGDMAQRAKVLDINKILADSLIESRSSGGDSGPYTGMTINEYRRNRFQSTQIPGYLKPYAFSGDLERRFGKDRCESNKYVFGSYVSETVKGSYFITYPEDLHNYLTDNFQKALEINTPQDLIHSYGTHVVLGVKMGGRFEYSLSTARSNFNTTNSTFYDYINKKAGRFISGTESPASLPNLIYFTEKEHIIIRGGDLTLVIGSHSHLSDWRASLTDDNLACIGFAGVQDAILPLSYFVADAQKRRALHNEIQNYIQNSRFEVREELVATSMFFDTDIRMVADLVEGDKKMSSSPDAIYRWNIEVGTATLADSYGDIYNTVRVPITYTIKENGDDNTTYKKNDTVSFDIRGKNIVGIDQYHAYNFSSNQYSPTKNWTHVIDNIDNHSYSVQDAWVKAGNSDYDVGYRISRLHLRLITTKPPEDVRTVLGKKK